MIVLKYFTGSDGTDGEKHRVFVPKAMFIRSGTAKTPLQPDGVHKGLTLL